MLGADPQRRGVEEATVQKIVPSLWFDRTAAAAADFYREAFPSSRIVSTSRYPTEGLLDFQRDLAGEVLTIEFEIGGHRITFINAGPNYRPNLALSFLVNVDPSSDDASREQLDDLWAALTDGGRVLMPLDGYPFAERYGWVEDRFGVNWQLMLSDPSGEPRPFLIPDFLFGGAAQNRAQEAIEYYTAVFAEARVGTLVRYEQQSGPAPAGAVMFADFELEGQWFAAMDSAVPQDVSFTPGFSLQVMCAGQDEIDRLWAALSAVPAAEQCGWCVDRFGVSWQIVPHDIGKLVSSPESYQAMMGMKKIVIADL